MFKSRTYRRVSTRVPGGSTVRNFVKRSPKQAHCAYCGKPLSGVPRQSSGSSKTGRRPERPYGGVLCSMCLRDEIKLGVRDE
ncbi:MAG: 50S ribosomal protein L34e [Candidatus Woesearchaeota archaeon]